MLYTVGLIIIPSGFILFSVVKQSLFKTRAEAFVATAFQFDGSSVANVNFKYEPSIFVDLFKENIPEIEVFIIGTPINDRDYKYIMGRMKEFKLEDSFLFERSTLTIRQNLERSSDPSALKAEVRFEILEDIYKKNDEKIRSKDEKIEFLEQQLIQYKRDSIPFASIYRELQINYEELERLGYARMVETNKDSQLDTIPVFLVQWDEEIKLSDEETEVRTKKIRSWLQVRLKAGHGSNSALLSTLAVCPGYAFSRVKEKVEPTPSVLRTLMV